MEWLLGNSAQMAEGPGEATRKGRGEPVGLSKEGLQPGVAHEELPPLEVTEMGEGSFIPCPCLPQLTDHLEYQVNLEMRRTTCLKSELTNCSFQEGKLYKVLGMSTRKGSLPGALLLRFWKNDGGAGGPDGGAEVAELQGRAEPSDPRQIAGYNNILAAGGLCWCTH